MKKKRVLAGVMALSLGLSTFSAVVPDVFPEGTAYAAAVDNMYDLRFTRLTDTRAEFQWKGTTIVSVEVRKRGGDPQVYEYKENIKADSRNVNTASVSGLKPDTEYEVFFDGESAAIFRTRGDRYNDYRYNRYYYDDYYYDDYYYYDDGYYYNGRWYYYDDRDDGYSSGYVRNFTIDHKSDTSVEMSWSGTSRMYTWS